MKLEKGRGTKFIKALAVLIALVLSTVPVLADQGETGKSIFKDGISAYKAKNYRSAKKLFKQAVEADKKLLAEAHLCLGKIAIQEKKWQLAVNHILAAKKLGLAKNKEREADICLAYILAYGKLLKGGAAKRKAEKPLSYRVSASIDWLDGLVVPLTTSNVSDPERKDDFRINLGVGLDYVKKVKEKGKVNLGYNFYQSLYLDATYLELQGHTLGGRYTHSINQDLNLSVNYGFNYYSLQSNKYLVSNVPGISLFLKEKEQLYGQVAYNYSDNDYVFNDDQDSKNNTIGVSQYLFKKNMKDFISIGYIFAKSDADLKRWDYNSHTLVLSGKYNLDDKNNITAQIAYANNKYQDNDPIETAKKRDDDIWSFGTQYSLTVNETIEIFARYAVSDHNSNITRQDYTSQTVAIGTNMNW